MNNFDSKKKYNILILYGGNGDEHDISKISKNFFINRLTSSDYNTYTIELLKDKWVIENKNSHCYLNKNQLIVDHEKISIDFVIPCLHGYPGESGEIQGLLKLHKIPYLGNHLEQNAICFNKYYCKTLANDLNIPTVESVLIYKNQKNIYKEVEQFIKTHNQVFIKPCNQGSSIGCYKLDKESDIKSIISAVFLYSNTALIEKFLTEKRELEVAVYQYKKEIKVAHPGEVISPKEFYDFDEKYSKDSKAKIMAKAKNLDEEIIKQIKNYSKDLFLKLNLRHMARIDFFLTSDKVLFNEINTFPGHTDISIFPMSIQQNGDDYYEYLKGIIEDEITTNKN